MKHMQLITRLTLLMASLATSFIEVHAETLKFRCFGNTSGLVCDIYYQGPCYPEDIEADSCWVSFSSDHQASGAVFIPTRESFTYQYDKLVGYDDDGDAIYEPRLRTVSCPVVRIDNSALKECKNVTSVTIGNSVTYIGHNAFANLTNLTSVTIGNSVKTIFSAFSGCTGLTSITIPDSVSFMESTFHGCTGLTSITIPNSVTYYGNAFSGCTGLTSVIFGDSVETISTSAFSGCTGLTSITIPNSVKSIEASAFSGCI